MRITRTLLALLVTIAAASCSEVDQNEDNLKTELELAADRILLNARVYTIDAQLSTAEAVVIDDGRIVFVGDDEGAKAWIGSETEVNDLAGQMLLPGFHDSHIHILIGVMADEECDLLRLSTVEAVRERLRECVELDGVGEDKWIIGGGWAEWLWPDANPQKDLLDELFPDRPVYLDSSFGHAAWVNSKAMELVGLDRDTEPPPGGVIERDTETGEPSGTLRESATQLVNQQLPDLSLEQRVDRVRAAIDLTHSVGITAVIEPGLDDYSIEPIVYLADAEALDLRVLASLSPISWQAGPFDDDGFEIFERREQWRRPNLDVDSVKIYMDGVIEFGTGALLEPYADPQYGLGTPFYDQETVNDYFARFGELGLQIHVHAIGDAGVRMALDGFEALRDSHGPSEKRHQIVHLQLIDEADRARFGELNVGAVFQSLWAYPDPAAMELDIPMIGEERTWQMYPAASVHQAGGRIVGGSDYFVTDLNPLQAIEVAVTRQDPYTNDGPVLNEAERLDLATMIRAYTINGAYQMGLEEEQGSIEVGKRADLVVLDKDLFSIPASEINEARVTMTIFDGRTVYE